MEFFDNIVDLVVEGMGCVVDGVITVSDFVEEHPVATSLVLTAATGGAAAWAGAGTIAAALGSTGILGSTATTGTVISSLSGAAATNASLAALGGGALSVGGGGMAVGTAVVAGAGATAGGAAGGTVAHFATKLRTQSSNG